jgi:putative ABC transport system permease protein
VMQPAQASLDPQGGDLEPQDYYTALPERSKPSDRHQRFMGGIARLSAGSTVIRANAELALLSERLMKLYPRENHAWVLSVVSSRTALLGAASDVLWLIFAAVIGILAVACANVGNMLGARWSTRDREIAVRRALGASSRRIGAQLFVEAGLLATIGALFGIGLAYAGLHVISGLLADALPRAAAIRIDVASLLYAVVAVVGSTLFAGVVPMFSLRSVELQAVLKSAGRGGDASARHRLRSALVVAEIAVALALVVIAGLTTRSFAALIDTPLGIRASGVVTSDFTNLPDQHYGTIGARARMQHALLTSLQALPGVRTAALAAQYPLGDVFLDTNAPVFGRSYPVGAEPQAAADNISPDYFRVLGIRVDRGRAFTQDDVLGTAPVAIVNETFVSKYLAGLSPIGARIRTSGWSAKERWETIVGVVGDERDSLTDAPYPEFYVPMAQQPPPYTNAVLYAPSVDPATIGREVQDAFARANPLMQPPQTYTVPQLVFEKTGPERFSTILFGALAAVALLLALSGIFGVVSFSVTQRSREFGIRIAHGASTGAILADVLRRTIATTVIGAAIGLALAAVGARTIATQLGAISPFDPATFATVVILIFLSAVLASLQPALRATRVQPVEALRYE